MQPRVFQKPHLMGREQAPPKLQIQGKIKRCHCLKSLLSGVICDTAVASGAGETAHTGSEAGQPSGVQPLGWTGHVLLPWGGHLSSLGLCSVVRNMGKITVSIS